MEYLLWNVSWSHQPKIVLRTFWKQFSEAASVDVSWFQEHFSNYAVTVGIVYVIRFASVSCVLLYWVLWIVNLLTASCLEQFSRKIYRRLCFYQKPLIFTTTFVAFYYSTIVSEKQMKLVFATQFKCLKYVLVNLNFPSFFHIFFLVYWRIFLSAFSVFQIRRTVFNGKYSLQKQIMLPFLRTVWLSFWYRNIFFGNFTNLKQETFSDFGVDVVVAVLITWAPVSRVVLLSWPINQCK